MTEERERGKGSKWMKAKEGKNVVGKNSSDS